MINIFEFNSKLIDFKEFKGLTSLIWLSYLRKAGLAFTDSESNDSEVVCRRLHPASRFRDIQILTNKVKESLPPYKNGSSDLGFCGYFKLGSDGVVRTLEETENFEDFYCNRNEEQNDYDFYDVFYDRYKDPRNYAKIRSKSIQISKESRKQLNQILSQKIAQNRYEIRIFFRLS